jgi:membrane-bound inhibitor of C-type lysozyme
MNRIFPIIVVIIAIMLAVWFVIVHSEKTNTTPTQGNLIATVSYACDAGKTINASFYDGTSTPATATQPPVPGGSVTVTLSDGRTATLPQTISADGARYANADESFIFWEKGSGAFVMENNQQTYANCLDTAQPANPVSQTYSTSARGFTLQIPNVAASDAMRYPDAYSVDESYQYQALGPTKTIGGVKFTIPGNVATGTNLSADSYISVEQIPGLASCTATPFVMAGTKTKVVTEGNTTYSMATSADAGAGNRYDETIYAIASSSPCTAVRYFIHYGAFQNFPAGTVREFNEQELVAGFDTIRRTLVLQK